ncbi:uncharacterized protein LOC125331680 [Corvus hawaiiensis]|uniref:uncharacterized protein LOC125331680 n=1 Tax=Corvus hawaiiensis TaxID=134902 RepID=UPI002019F025|nr:uncharacterized protein LOC125331680 [Corvus hawaiiensis]
MRFWVMAKRRRGRRPLLRNAFIRLLEPDPAADSDPALSARFSAAFPGVGTRVVGSPEAQEAVLQDLAALVCPWLYLFRCSPAVLSVLPVGAVGMGRSKEQELNPTEVFRSRQREWRAEVPCLDLPLDCNSSRWVCAAQSTKEGDAGVPVCSPVELGRDAEREIPGKLRLCSDWSEKQWQLFAVGWFLTFTSIPWHCRRSRKFHGSWGSFVCADFVLQPELCPKCKEHRNFWVVSSTELQIFSVCSLYHKRDLPCVKDDIEIEASDRGRGIGCKPNTNGEGQRSTATRWVSPLRRCQLRDNSLVTAGTSRTARGSLLLCPRQIHIPRCPRDKSRAMTHGGNESGVLSQDSLGGVFESPLEMGIPKKGPLRPHKGKVSHLITMPRCTGQSSPGACCHLSIVCSLSFGHLVSQVFCLSPSMCLQSFFSPRVFSLRRIPSFVITCVTGTCMCLAWSCSALCTVWYMSVIGQGPGT